MSLASKVNSLMAYNLAAIPLADKSARDLGFLKLVVLRQEHLSACQGFIDQLWCDWDSSQVMKANHFSYTSWWGLCERSGVLVADLYQCGKSKLSAITCTVLLCFRYVKGVGPRYCPSIEDKIVRFATRIAPALLFPSTWYRTVCVQGRQPVCQKMYKSDLVHHHIFQKGYAMNSYEYIWLRPTSCGQPLETKKISGLFTAGQTTETSGHEEAAGQGIIAGINAALKIQGKPELILKRSDGYIGVMIDDLRLGGTVEPYRLWPAERSTVCFLRHERTCVWQRLGREIGYRWCWLVSRLKESIWQRWSAWNPSSWNPSRKPMLK